MCFSFYTLNIKRWNGCIRLKLLLYWTSRYIRNLAIAIRSRAQHCVRNRNNGPIQYNNNVRRIFSRFDITASQSAKLDDCTHFYLTSLCARWLLWIYARSLHPWNLQKLSIFLPHAVSRGLSSFILFYFLLYRVQTTITSHDTPVAVSLSVNH